MNPNDSEGARNTLGRQPCVHVEKVPDERCYSIYSIPGHARRPAGAWRTSNSGVGCERLAPLSVRAVWPCLMTGPLALPHDPSGSHA